MPIIIKKLPKTRIVSLAAVLKVLGDPPIVLEELRPLGPITKFKLTCKIEYQSYTDGRWYQVCYFDIEDASVNNCLRILALRLSYYFVRVGKWYNCKTINLQNCIVDAEMYSKKLNKIIKYTK